MSNYKNLELEGRSVCITGGSGFIGSRFLEIAEKYQADVTKLNRNTLNGELLLNADTDFIVHLAGQKSLGLAAKQPVETLEAEFRMAISLLEAARLMENPPRKILLVSSVGVYDGEGKVSESDPNFVSSIYAASKMNIENLGRAYAEEYGLPVIIARLSNVYGPGQTKEALVPSIINQMNRNISESGKIMLGNIKSVRDFIFIDDVVEGFIKLLLRPTSSGEVFNVSTGMGHSVEEIVSILSEHLDYRGTINVEQTRIRPNERQSLVASNELLKLKTDWRPQYNLKEGLAKTVSYYAKIKGLGENRVL
ncbi:NAD(P)-dependent oxidoreductase [Candidatus Pelagibacter sp.]|nr:NAD(P)-dependent oxidoreductase [Candidatus Pelagibacter sp.]